MGKINWDDLGIDNEELRDTLEAAITKLEQEADEPGEAAGISPKEVVKVVAEACDDLRVAADVLYAKLALRVTKAVLMQVVYPRMPGVD